MYSTMIKVCAGGMESAYLEGMQERDMLAKQGTPRWRSAQDLAQYARHVRHMIPTACSGLLRTGCYDCALLPRRPMIML